jgi:hypothetical protein
MLACLEQAMRRSRRSAMKVTTLVLAGALALAASAAGADSMSLNGFRDRVLPVLVKVDAHGKVTRVSSAVELTPRFDRLLRQTLDQWITGPAMDHGKPISSQFVMKLGMQAAARADGAYDAGFVYLSSSPVPPGEWIWQHEDGHRLALVRADGVYYRARRHPMSVWRQPWFDDRRMPQPAPSAPAQTPASRSRPGR